MVTFLSFTLEIEDISMGIRSAIECGVGKVAAVTALHAASLVHLAR